MFRRRRRSGDDEPVDDRTGEPTDVDAGGDDEDDDLEPDDLEPDVPPRPAGPWDVDDVPEDDGVERLDLGSIRVPVSEGIELRLEVDPDGRPMAVNLLMPNGALQVTAFAAPRTDGIWDEVRSEIADSLQAGPGSAEESVGPFGAELKAAVPTAVADRGTVLMPARFLGVDGPRWFLRGLLSGLAAQDPQEATALEESFRQMVVVRGSQPLPVRDPLGLTLPADVQQRIDQARVAEAEQAAAPEGSA